MQDTNNVKHLRVHFLCKGASNRISYYIKKPPAGHTLSGGQWFCADRNGV